MKGNTLVIAIGNDHTAYQFKKPIITYLKENNYEVLDLGTNDNKKVDYPDFANAVTNKIITGKAHFGILICGTGIGISIAANRKSQIRCALCYEEETVRLARMHNDANVLALGARLIASEKAVALVKLFLTTKSSTEEHHLARIEKLQ